MLVKTFKDLMQHLKKGPLYPVYVFHGEEPYYIDEVVKWMEGHILSEDDKAFNQTILYGKDIDYKAVLDNARRIPLMADRQLVVVREAQDLKTWDSLAGYFEQPNPQTVLVLAHKHKKLDVRKKLNKALVDDKKPHPQVMVFQSDPIRDTALPDWIGQRLKEEGYTYAPELPLFLAETLGNDLNKVSNELQKLYLNVPKSQAISLEEARKHIGLSKAFSVFDFQDALGSRQVAKAVQIARYFAGNSREHPLVVILGSLYGFYSKLYALKSLGSASMSDQEASKLTGLPFFRLPQARSQAKYFSLEQFEQIFRLLKQYDLRGKGTDLTGRGPSELSDDTGQEALLLELTYRLLAV